MLRSTRRVPDAPWSLSRQGCSWTEIETLVLKRDWARPELQREQIAAGLQRTLASVAQQAHKMGLGARPSEQSTEAHLRGRGRPWGPVNKAPAAAPPPEEELERVGAAFLTARLRDARERLRAGVPAADLIAALKLPAVEAEVLRGWERGA